MIALNGTRVVVTGATSGLGRAMAEALVAGGARVAVTSRVRSRAQAAAAALGPAAVGIEMDVRDGASVLSGTDEIHARFGGIDVLVNNAGIGMRTVNPRFLTDPQPFWAVTPEGFSDVLETKVTGCFLVARAVVPGMLAGGRWARHHDLDERADDDPPRLRALRARGPAVEALARVMAADLAGTPVSANILLPGGATATGMIPAEVAPETRATFLDPAIMGPPVLWLASEEAEGVHDERIIATEFEDWLARR